MKYLYLYTAIAPKDPKTGKVQGMKYANSEAWSFVLAITTIAIMTIVAVAYTVVWK